MSSLGQDFLDKLEEDDEDYKKFTERDNMQITRYISRLK